MRLIDADALSKAMYDEAFENDESYNETNPMARWDSGLWIRYKMFENVIDEQPTIRTPHGEWIDMPRKMFKCSECGQIYQVLEPKNFCSKCGAKMFDKDIDVPVKEHGGLVEDK